MLARTEKGQERILKFQELTTEFIREANLSPDQTAASMEQMQRQGAPVALISTLVQERKKLLEDLTADQRKLQEEELAKMLADVQRSEAETAALKATQKKVEAQIKAATDQEERERLKQKTDELKTTVAASTAATEAAQSNLSTVAKLVAGTVAVAGVAYGLYHGVPAAYGAVGKGLGYVGSAFSNGASGLGQAGLGLAKMVAIPALLNKGTSKLSNWYYGAQPLVTGGRTRRARQ